MMLINYLEFPKVSSEMWQQGSVFLFEIRDIHDQSFSAFSKTDLIKGTMFIVCQLLTLKSMFLSLIVVSQVGGFSWL